MITEYKQISDFWKLKNSIGFNSKKELKETLREYYTDDFIDKASNWLESVKDINSFIVDAMEKIIDIKDYEPMTFNYFCKTLMELIDQFIDENDDIKEMDVAKCTENLMNKYIFEQVHSITSKKYTISNLMTSIGQIKYNQVKEDKDLNVE